MSSYPNPYDDGVDDRHPDGCGCPDCARYHCWECQGTGYVYADECDPDYWMDPNKRVPCDNCGGSGEAHY